MPDQRPLSVCPECERLSVRGWVYCERCAPLVKMVPARMVPAERAEKAERERGDLILAGRMVEAKLEDALRERDDYQRAFEETQDITISQADEIVDLRRERDELAAALDALLSAFCRMPDAMLTPDDPRHEWWFSTADQRLAARAVLARVRGTA